MCLKLKQTNKQTKPSITFPGSVLQALNCQHKESFPKGLSVKIVLFTLHTALLKGTKANYLFCFTNRNILTGL